MTFFAAVYGQEFGRVQAGWIARARAERPGGWGRGARGWADAASKFEPDPARLRIGVAQPSARSEERERCEEDGERWDGLS